MSGENIPEMTNWKSKCRKPIRSKNGLLLKNMPTVLRYIDESHGIRRFVSSDGKNNRITKCIILTGVSGSGKSLIINKFINYIYGVKFKDNFRLTLISDDEDSGNDQEPEEEANGTSFVTAYEIIWEKGFPVEFNLILIDTPGFAVDTGIANNEGIVEKIQKFFHSKDFFPQQFLNAVALVIPAHENLQSAEQEYVFDQILSVFGNNLAESFTVFFSFADRKTPAATGEIENTGISPKFMFQFNNSALYAKNIDGENLHDTEYVRNCGQKDMEKVLKVLSNFEPQPLYLTNINLEQRNELKFRLMRSVQQQDTAVKQLEDIETMLYELKALDMQITDHKKSSVDFFEEKKYY